MTAPVMLRHNRIELGKWRDRDSHAEHLFFLAPPREIRRVAGWEQRDANLDLYRTRDGGTLALAALEPKFWSKFCTAVDRKDLLRKQLWR